MPPRPAIGEQFNQWVAEHVTVLYRVAYRLLGDSHAAEDVLQDTFRSAWTSRHLYDRTRSERAWLLAILRRRVADHWRRRRSREVSFAADAAEPAAPNGAEPFRDELSAAMQRGLAKLPTEIRETLLLVVVGELTHQEAADLQGIPLGTVLSRVSRGRSRLRDFLIEEGRISGDDMRAKTGTRNSPD
ncbi:MAG: RNA polymerase sigma factor [Planctomycetia bacterium]|nr:RNA polymerase sigma factor [Planctomycetia bacterium]